MSPGTQRKHSYKWWNGKDKTMRECINFRQWNYPVAPKQLFCCYFYIQHFLRVTFFSRNGSPDSEVNKLKFYFASINAVRSNTFMRKGKDPDPYLWLWLMDPDPRMPNTAYWYEMQYFLSIGNYCLLYCRGWAEGGLRESGMGGAQTVHAARMGTATAKQSDGSPAQPEASQHRPERGIGAAIH
jgi:hypothetical protein